MVCGVHNHDLNHKLKGHPFVGHLIDEEDKLVAHMTMSMVLSKHVIMNLKRK